MTTIETKIARAKELAEKPWGHWNDEEIGDAYDLLPDLASECERLREENAILQSQVDNSDANIEQMRMIWKPRAVKAEAEVSRLRALVEERPHDRSCRWINPQLLSVKEMNSGLYNCDCWKSRLHLPE